MDRPDDKELWDLLGKAPSREVSPFFARNVLRQIRQEAAAPEPALWRWLSWKRVLPALAGAATVALLFLTGPRTATEGPEEWKGSPIASVAEQDLTVVAELDELLAYDDDGLWTETPAL